jgi:hypothetical protein
MKNLRSIQSQLGVGMARAQKLEMPVNQRRFAVKHF